MTAPTSGIPQLLPQAVDEVIPTCQFLENDLWDIFGEISGAVAQGFKFVDSVAGVFGIETPLDEVAKALDEFSAFMENVKAAISAIKDFVVGVAMPWILPSFASTWREIAEELRQTGETLGPEGLRGPDSPNWTGDAHDAYVRAAAAQVTASLFAAGVADEQAVLLDEAAIEGQEVYTAVYELIKAIIGLIKEARKSMKGGWIGILIFIVMVIDDVIKLINAILELIDAITTFLDTQSAAAEQITASIEGADRYFPSGAWAQIVA